MFSVFSSAFWTACKDKNKVKLLILNLFKIINIGYILNSRSDLSAMDTSFGLQVFSFEVEITISYAIFREITVEVLRKLNPNKGLSRRLLNHAVSSTAFKSMKWISVH